MLESKCPMKWELEIKKKKIPWVCLTVWVFFVYVESDHDILQWAAQSHTVLFIGSTLWVFQQSNWTSGTADLYRQYWLYMFSSYWTGPFIVLFKGLELDFQIHIYSYVISVSIMAKYNPNHHDVVLKTAGRHPGLDLQPHFKRSKIYTDQTRHYKTNRWSE